jgi:hypothetical protein
VLGYGKKFKLSMFRRGLDADFFRREETRAGEKWNGLLHRMALADSFFMKLTFTGLPEL